MDSIISLLPTAVMWTTKAKFCEQNIIAIVYKMKNTEENNKKVFIIQVRTFKLVLWNHHILICIY